MPRSNLTSRVPPAAVSHVESFALTAADMSTVFQRKFQTSCSVSKLPGKEEKDSEIMLQASVVPPRRAVVCTPAMRVAPPARPLARRTLPSCPLPSSGLLQGDLQKAVAVFLQEQYGIPPALIELKGGKAGK